MKISECMTKNVRLCGPNDTIQDAARTMKEIDTGLLPVGENDRLIGTITERDIVLRALATDMPYDTPVRTVMSQGVKYCYESDKLEDVAEQMGEEKLRRILVLNKAKRLVGIVSLGDIAKYEHTHSGKALRKIASAGNVQTVRPH
jgi:CBS domain-containing protein